MLDLDSQHVKHGGKSANTRCLVTSFYLISTTIIIIIIIICAFNNILYFGMTCIFDHLYLTNCIAHCTCLNIAP